MLVGNVDALLNYALPNRAMVMDDWAGWKTTIDEHPRYIRILKRLYKSHYLVQSHVNFVHSFLLGDLRLE